MARGVDAVTERQYAMDIKRKAKALGVWRDEFERTQRRLARLYARIDRLEEEFAEEGAQLVIEYTNKGGATNRVKNPYVTEIDFLYEQAIIYERELGLTAAALKKINEAALHPAKDESPMAGLLELVQSRGTRAG